jgi:hypothetical protein
LCGGRGSGGRNVKSPKDGLAEDYFESGNRRPPPERLATTVQRVGWGVLHVSYRRPAPKRRGDGASAGSSRLYVGLIDFAQSVWPERVTADFGEAVRREFVTGFGVDPVPFAQGAIALGRLVGTPVLQDWVQPPG